MENKEDDKAYSNLKKYLGRKNGSWRDFFQSWIKRPAYVVIIIANIAIFFLPGLNVHKQAPTILWIYLVQSLMIGAMHFLKLLFYRFAPATRAQDWRNPKALAFFFLFHYGFFHFVYMFFIPPTSADWDLVWQGALVFGFALIVNTIQHFQKENSGKYNANDFMFLPYVRIFPIHIAIILGMFLSLLTGSLSGVVIVLMILKIAIELFLEYMQQLGVSFSDIAELSKKE